MQKPAVNDRGFLHISRVAVNSAGYLPPGPVARDGVVHEGRYERDGGDDVIVSWFLPFPGKKMPLSLARRVVDQPWACQSGRQ